MSNINAKSINVERLNVTENFIYHRGKKTKMLDVDASGNLCLTNKLGINICPGTKVTDGSANQILEAALDVSGGLQLAFNEINTISNTPDNNLGSLSFFKDGSGNYRFYGCEMDNSGNPSWRAMTESHAQSSYWLKNADKLYYNDGNVGIGTNSPTEKLEVSGNASISGELNVSLINTSAGTSIFQGQVECAHNNPASAALYIPTGKVGIGTNSPTFRLQVASVDGSPDSLKLNNIMSWHHGINGGTDYGPFCKFPTDLLINSNSFFWLQTGTGNLNLFDNIVTPGNSVYGIKFATLTSHDVRFTFGNPTQTGTYIFNGNVGIGTPNPVGKLDVAGTIGCTLIQTGNIEVGSHFYASGSFVGIGTSNTSTAVGKLMIEGNGDSQSTAGMIRFKDKDSASQAPNWFIGPLRSGYAAFQITPATNTTPDEPDITKVFQVSYNGNVGIGTTSPSEKLVVNGNINATSFNSTSDLNKKENINTILNATEKMSLLRGVSYNLKSDKDNKKHYGVIAQELEKVFPDMVNGEEGNKSVAYMEIIGVLIETVKDLNKRIENLEQSSNN